MRPTASRRAMRRVAIPIALASAALAPPIAAWSPTTQRAIALEAARRAPAPWNAQLVRHAEDLMAGAYEPFSEREPARHLKNEDGRGRLDRVVAEELQAALAAVASGRSWGQIARRLGRLSHFVADANFPLNASAGDPAERRYFADYALYAESARDRFALVAYGGDLAPGAAGVDRLVREALARSRKLYPAVGREYRRIDWTAGRERFDDRSTAFAAASLGYSHAVSDVARLFRYVATRASRPPVEIRLAATRTGSTGASD